MKYPKFNWTNIQGFRWSKIDEISTLELEKYRDFLILKIKDLELQEARITTQRAVDKAAYRAKWTSSTILNSMRSNVLSNKGLLSKIINEIEAREERIESDKRNKE